MHQSSVVGHDDRSHGSELRSEEASALAGAVQQAVAEALNPTPRAAPPGFPVQHFMHALLRAADDLGVELTRDEILEIFEIALRRHASMVIGDQIRDVLAEPFKQHALLHPQGTTP